MEVRCVKCTNFFRVILPKLFVRLELPDPEVQLLVINCLTINLKIYALDDCALNDGNSAANAIRIPRCVPLESAESNFKECHRRASCE